jgi:membrane associated rhomboid family serine protease
MLSAEERRRLDEIERLLQADDPKFVSRMRAETRRPRRWAYGVFYCLLWIVAFAVGVFMNWLAGVIVAAVGAASAATVTAVSAYRRRRRS